MKSYKKVIAFFSMLAISLLLPMTAFSANSDQLNLGISPLIVEIEADPGETITEYINIDIGTSTGISLGTSVRDFYYDENDELQFMTPEDEKDPDLKQFTLKNWLQVDEHIQMTSSKKKVPVTISVPKDATPGGRYAMILFSKAAVTPDAEGAAVGVGGKVGAMVLVSVRGEFSNEGGLTEELSTGRLTEDGDFNPTKLFLGGSLFKNGPFSFKFRYKNHSATHVVPQGTITVKNLFGGKVGYFNFESKRVFPGVSRSIYGTLEKNFLFGIYKAQLDVADGDGNPYQSSTFFFALPLKLLLLIAFIIGGVLGFFRYYNRWLISKVLNEKGKLNAKKKK